MFLIFYTILLAASYAFIGGSIKYLDDITDRLQAKSKRNPMNWVLTVSIAALVNIWAFFDVYTAALAFTLIVGLTIMRKIDNPYFIVQALTTLPIILYTILRIDVILFLIPTLIVLIPPVVIDEILDTNATKITNPHLQWLSTHRPIMKIVVLILPFFNLFTVIHAIAFWSFDIAYDLITHRLRAQSN